MGLLSNRLLVIKVIKSISHGVYLWTSSESSKNGFFSWFTKDFYVCYTRFWQYSYKRSRAGIRISTLQAKSWGAEELNDMSKPGYSSPGLQAWVFWLQIWSFFFSLRGGFYTINIKSSYTPLIPFRILAMENKHNWQLAVYEPPRWKVSYNVICILASGKIRNPQKVNECML